MSETPDESTASIPAATPAVTPAHAPVADVPVAPVQQKPHRLNVVAAWVGIVAGAVVIVAVIFGTGFMLGAHSGNHRGGGGGGGGFDRHHGNVEEHRGGPPMWGPGPGGPGFGGPGGQGGPGFSNGPDGSRGPGQLPQPPAGSTAPTPPTR